MVERACNQCGNPAEARLSIEVFGNASGMHNHGARYGPNMEAWWCVACFEEALTVLMSHKSPQGYPTPIRIPLVDNKPAAGGV